jgi:DNA polymerase IV
LADATNLTNTIWKAAAELFDRSLSSELMPVRLLGVGATKLTRTLISQGTLYEDANKRESALDQTIDTIRAKFGTGKIQRGSLIDKPAETD